MKLYLSSYQLGKESHRLIPVAERNNRALLIPNALDAFNDPDRRSETIRRETQDLKNLGFTVEVLDLRRYFGEENELRHQLQDAGFVWTLGGNAFTLRKAMQESGLDVILIFNMRENNFVYGGYSAGACVAAPSLYGIDLVDDPEAAPDGYSKEVIWEGLGLIDYHIAPHFRSDHPESDLIEKTIAYWEKNNFSYIALRDGEVIIVE